jgi:large conductance mechanosensitive channel
MDPLQKIASLEPTKKVASFVDEFKTFAFKGNVIDLAVGVIIGAAFGNIVNSLVKQIIMPLISVILPAGGGYTGWKWTIEGIDIHYGQFLGELVNFLVVALAVFLFIVKFVGWIMRSKKEEAAAPAPLTKDQELLMEIRDLLKNAKA